MLMSKITVSAVLTVLRLVLHFLGKSVNLIYTIIDLCDDAHLNASAPRPEWLSILSSAINSIEDVISHCSSIEDNLSLSDSN